MALVAMEEMPIASGTVMPLVGGGYALVRPQPPNAWAVQRYGTDGEPLGAETTVVAAMGQDATGASISLLAGGGYAVVWLGNLVEFERLGGSIYHVIAQTFTAKGDPLGEPREIAQSTPGFYGFPRPAALPRVAALRGSGFAVVWGQNDGARGLGIYVQRFGVSGTPAGPAQRVSALGSGFLGIVGLSTGGYLVTWGTLGGAPEGGARAYGADDMPLAPVQAVGPGWSDYMRGGGEAPAVASLAGGAVMVWRREAFPYVRVIQLAADAAPLAGARIVDESTVVPPSDTHTAPAVTGLADGGYVVAWIETGEVHARRFTPSGAPAGPETRINLVTTSIQPPTAAVAMADGGFMLAWSGVGAEGARRNYARRFPAGGLLAP